MRKQIFFPHVDAIVKHYIKHFGGKIAPMEIEALREILYEYIEQRVEKTYVYNSEKIGASFVYSMIDTSDIAKKLYIKSRSDGDLKFNVKQEPTTTCEMEFVFVGGFINSRDGNEYASQEEVIHRMIEEIPRALQAIDEGNEPKQKQIYTLASPTNELGYITDKFVESLNKSNATEQIGLLYADFISSVLKINARNEKTICVYFSGISMGSGFAIETAQYLITNGILTQSNENKKAPFLQLRINLPAGQSSISEKIKKWQIPIGYVLEIAYTMIANSYMRFIMHADSKFIKSKNAILAEKGILINMSPHQAKVKKKIISRVYKTLMTGIPVPNNLKVTEVIGIVDPLMYSLKFRKLVEKKRNKYSSRRKLTGESLGENIVSDPKNPNRRTFGIFTSHNIPFLRKSEFQRLKKAVKMFEDLKNKK